MVGGLLHRHSPAAQALPRETAVPRQAGLEGAVGTRRGSGRRRREFGCGGDPSSSRESMDGTVVYQARRELGRVELRGGLS